MITKRLHLPLRPLLLAAAVAALAAPAWAQSVVRESRLQQPSALTALSAEKQAVYKKVSAAIVRVKIDQDITSLLPPDFKEDFEKWREEMRDRRGGPPADGGPGVSWIEIQRKDHRRDDSRPMPNIGAPNRPPEANDRPPPARDRGEPGMRDREGPGPREDSSRSAAANLWLLRRYIEHRAQKDPDLFLRARALAQRMDALRGGNAGEVLGVTLDKDGHVLVPMILLKNPRGDTEVAVTLADGTEAKAAVRGADYHRGFSVIKLDKPQAAVLPAEGRPEPGAMLMCITANQGAVGWVSAPGAALKKTGDDRITVFGSDERGPMFLFTIDGSLAGAGFDRSAWTADALKQDIDDIIKNGTVRRKQLGVKYDLIPLDSPYRQQYKALGNRPALRVKEVFPDTPAEQAGMKEGDFLLSIDNRPISLMALPGIMRDLRGRDKVPVGLLRDGKEISVEVPIGGRQ